MGGVGLRSMLAQWLPCRPTNQGRRVWEAAAWQQRAMKAEHPRRNYRASPEVALLAACKERGIPVLCSAGAGAKADPTRLRIVDISESSIDPLARAVRHKCVRRKLFVRPPHRRSACPAALLAAAAGAPCCSPRVAASDTQLPHTSWPHAITRLGRKRGVRGGIPVLMSTEKPRCELVATEQMQAGNPLDFQVGPSGRQHE